MSSVRTVDIMQVNKPVLSVVWLLYQCFVSFSFFCRNSPQWAGASSLTRFLNHTRRTTVGRTPLDEWSARRRDLHLTTHNTHNRQTSMPQAGFEPTISAGERPQTYGLDRAATGTGVLYLTKLNLLWKWLIVTEGTLFLKQSVFCWFWFLWLMVMVMVSHRIFPPPTLTLC